MGIAGLLVMLCPLAAIAGEPPTVSSVAPVDLKALPTRRCDYLYLVDAVLDGRGPFTFAVDTGCTVTLISPRAADLVIGESAVSQFGPASKHLGSKLAVRELSVAGVPLQADPVVIFDLTNLRKATAAEIDGIVGFSAFAGKLLIIDGPKGRISVAEGRLDAGGRDVWKTVASPETDEKGRPLLGVSSPRLSVQIGGKAFECILDLGAGGGFAIPSFEGVATAGPPTLVGSIVGQDGAHARFACRLSGDIRLGPGVHVRPIVDSVPGSAVIGMDVLSRYFLVFDQASNLVQLSCPEPGPFTSEALRGVGAVIDPGESAWTVRDVAKGSPAELAGVRAGDRVTAVNDKRTSDLSCFPLRRLADAEVVRFTIERDGEKRDIPIPVAVLVP